MATISNGPVELVALAVPDLLSPDLIRELAAVSQNDAVRLLDLVLLTKTDDGALEIQEVGEVSIDDLDFDLGLDGGGLTSHEDLEVIAAGLPSGTSAVVLLIENVWAAGIAAALEQAGGGVVASEWLPAAVVNDIANALT